MSDSDPSRPLDSEVEPTVVGTPIEALKAVEATPRIARGDAVGRYVVLDLVGRGGMGRVYKAYDPKLKREVALKLLRTSVTEMEVRAFREAQAMAALAHPNVVPVYDVDREHGRLYIAMEFIPGKTLRAWIKAQPPKPNAEHWRRVLDVMLQAGRGLAAAHEAGLVHRDFKPSNVVIGDDGRVRVMDFGLARGSGIETETGDFSGDSVEMTSPLTQMGTVLGTPPYMPPEQHRAGTIDARSDQFAFCVVFYEALYRKRPFVADRLETLAQLKEAGLSEWPTDPSVPAWLAKAIRRGLSPRRAGRHLSMRALLAALERRTLRRSNRAPLLLASGALVIGAGSAIYVSGSVEDTPPEDPCATTLRAVDALWGDDDRTRLRAELSAADLPFAEDTASRAVEQLDEYATAWSESRHEACVATQVRHEQSEALMDRRIACLDRAGAALGSTVHELSSPTDARVARNAVRTVLGLPDLSRCSDTERLLAALGRPEDPSVAAEVAAIEQRLEETEVKRRAGHHEVALADARELMISAQRVDYEPVRAEVQYLLGRLLARTGAYDEADTALRNAYHTAIAAGHDDVASNAASELTFVLGSLLHDHDTASVFAQESEAWARKVGSDDALARHENAYATLLQRQARFKEAQRRYEIVLEIRERAGDPNALPVANALNNLANVFMDQGRPREAAPHYARAAAIAEKLFGPEHLMVGAFINNLGNAHTRQGHYDEAWPLYERALQIFERTYGPEHPDVAGFIVNMAGTASARGTHDEALALFTRGLKLERKLLGEEHPRIAETLTGLGQLHRERGEPEIARPLLEQALTINEGAYDDPHPEIASSLEALADLDLEQQRAPLALERLQRAARIRTSVENNATDLARADLLRARAMWQSDQRSAARVVAQTALDRLPAAEAAPKVREELQNWLDAHR